MKIEYNINNEKWQEYNSPFKIYKTSIVKARGFKNQKKYGQLEKKIIKHLATGKKVNYTYPYNTNYQGTGKGNLVDGLIGSQDNFRDGYYQGFFGTDLEVIIDFEKTTTFSQIQAIFFQYHLSWIILPSSVSYSISNDGKNFQKVEIIKNKIPLMREGKFKYTFSFENKNTTARYLKINAKSVGNLPEEHPAAGSDSWMFIDEIIVN